MFIIIQAHEYHKFPNLLTQMFKLRKKVFADQLKWDVSTYDNQEHDRYDKLGPAYLIWCNSDYTKLYGTIRLMPTTGPTLLYDVFRKTFPDVVSLEAPGIWEGTRMCLDEDLIAIDFSEIDAGRAFSLMLLALCEVALKYGIHTMVSNFEPQMKRIYSRTGVKVNELGRADGYGKHPVCCGMFDVTQKTLSDMRLKLGINQPLFIAKKAQNPIPVSLEKVA